MLAIMAKAVRVVGIGVKGSEQHGWDQLEAGSGQPEVSYRRRRRPVASCRDKNVAILFTSLSRAWLIKKKKKRFISPSR